MMLFLASFTRQLQSHMTSLAVLVAASEPAKVMDVPVARAGYDMGLLYHFSSMLMVCGFIRRLSALRISQIVAAPMSVDLALGITSEVWVSLWVPSPSVY